MALSAAALKQSADSLKCTGHEVTRPIEVVALRGREPASQRSATCQLAYTPAEFERLTAK